MGLGQCHHCGNTVLIAYPHYARKRTKTACSKGQSTEHIKDTGFSPSLPLLTGNQGTGAEADGWE